MMVLVAVKMVMQSTMVNGSDDDNTLRIGYTFHGSDT